MDERGFTHTRTLGDPPKLERWERPASDEEAAPAIAQLQELVDHGFFAAEEFDEARSLIKMVELRLLDGTVVRGPSLRRSMTRRERQGIEEARQRLHEAKERRNAAAEIQAARDAERARILEERQLPADWGFDGDEGLPSHGGPLFFDAVDGYTLNQLTAEDANTIARFAFARANFLFDLARADEPVTFTPHELFAIANGFESIGFNLGDGVAFDFADAPQWPRHYRAFCDCVPHDDRAEMRKTGVITGAEGCDRCSGAGVVVEELAPVDDQTP